VSMTLLEEHAREKAGASEEWKVYLWECLPAGDPTQVYRLTGAIAPLSQHGPQKGNRAWWKMDKATVQTVYISATDHERWQRNWERKTGKCAECQGSGRTWATLRVDKPTECRPCSRCAGSGKPKGEVDADS
jgi:hypothetical protein